MPPSVQQTKSEMWEMEPYDFEHFVADVWEARGFTTEVRQASRDLGIDITATKSNTKVAIQVKRYSGSNTVGSQAVRNYATLYQQDNTIDSVLLVTSGSYTEPAKDLAKKLNVDLIDGDQIAAISVEHDVTSADYVGPDSKPMSAAEMFVFENFAVTAKDVRSAPDQQLQDIVQSEKRIRRMEQQTKHRPSAKKRHRQLIKAFKSNQKQRVENLQNGIYNEPNTTGTSQTSDNGAGSKGHRESIGEQSKKSSRTDDAESTVDTSEDSASKRSLSSDVRETYPTLAILYENEAYYSERRFLSYLRKVETSVILRRVTREIFDLLGYEDLQSDTEETYFDIKATKSGLLHPIKVFCDTEIDNIDIDLITSFQESERVGKCIIVTFQSPPAIQTTLNSASDSIKVIDEGELQKLVEGAILRITETH